VKYSKEFQGGYFFWNTLYNYICSRYLN